MLVHDIYELQAIDKASLSLAVTVINMCRAINDMPKHDTPVAQ